MVCSSRVLGEQKYGYWMDVSWIGMYRSELAMGAWGLNLQICVIHHSSRVSFQNIMFHNVIIFQGAFVASENIDIIWIIYHNGAWSRLNLWIPNLPLLLRKHLCHQGENWTSREISANINWEQKSAPYIRLGFWDKNTSKKWDSSKHSDVTPPQREALQTYQLFMLFWSIAILPFRPRRVSSLHLNAAVLDKLLHPYLHQTS